MMHKLRGNVTKQSPPPLLPVYGLLIALLYSDHLTLWKR